MKVIRHILTVSMILLFIWAGLSFCVWCFSGLISLWFPPPSRLELPWVDLNDFVETPDGRVFIDLPFQHRVGCFDRDGKLIGYYPTPEPGKDTELAAGANGYLYYRRQNNVHTLTSTWKPVAVTRHENVANQTWELDENLLPRYAPQRGDEPPHDRPVAAGEVLFSAVRAWRKIPQREFFLCSDGSTLWRESLSLERRLPSGEVVAVYAPAWYVSPFGIWGMISLFLFVLLVVVGNYFTQSRSRPTPDLVIEADGTLLFQGEPVALADLADKLETLQTSLPTDTRPAAISILKRYNPETPPSEALQAIESVIRTGRYIDMRDERPG